MTSTLDHIIFYGQSFSNGSESVAIMDDPEPGCYMAGDPEAKGTELVPLLLGGRQNERPVVPALNALSRLMSDNAADKKEFVGSCFGAGGMSIAQLMSNMRQTEIMAERSLHYAIDDSGRWKVFTQGLQNCRAAAENAGKYIRCPAIVYMQGERDFLSDEMLSERQGSSPRAYACGNDRALYRKYMYRLKEDMQHEVVKAYGQPERPLFFIYQCSARFITTNQMQIVRAQQEFAAENDDVVLLPAYYPFPHYESGHLSSNGYRWYAEYIARALFRAVYMQKPCSPLFVDNVRMHGGRIILRIGQAVQPLVMDAFTLPAAHQNGFAVFSDNAEIPIDNISLCGNEIILSLKAEPPKAAQLEICYAGLPTGGRGNIRDSAAGVSHNLYADDTADTGQSGLSRIVYRPTDAEGNPLAGRPYPLHNWLSPFCVRIC
jgi:hypothetical protein